MELITTIPIEETYLRVFEKPKKVRLSRQVIDFNYAHLSPYKNGGHVAYQTDANIYVWFFSWPIPAGNTIYIPEGYLLWKFFKERRDAIVMLPREKSLTIQVITGGELRAQVTGLVEVEQERALEMLRREFSLQEAAVIRLEKSARFSVKPADVLTFAAFDFRPSDLMDKGIGLLTTPLIVFLLITAGFTFFQERRLESLSAEKSLRLSALKRENAPLQTALEQVREQGTYWQDFIAREQAYPDFYRILSSITSVVHQHGGYLNNVEYSENRITIWTGIKSSEATIIKDLLATGIFSDVKILSSVKDSGKPEFNNYNLAITLSKAGSKDKS